MPKIAHRVETMAATQSISDTEDNFDMVIPSERNWIGSFPLTHQPKEAQRIIREGILIAGGAVAILLQVANPGIAQGVNAHSDFAYRPIDRLRTTMTYVYTITFGTPSEKATMIRTVHRAHSTIKGPNYSADDPELQLWVAATLYVTATDIYSKIFGNFDKGTADKIYQEYSIPGTALRVPQCMWPADREAFWTYWNEKLRSFEITDQAKDVAKDLLYAKELPIWIKVNMPVLRILTTEWLPPRLRVAYGLKTSKSSRAIYTLLMGLARAIYPHLPNAVRQYPLRFYMKDMRKRMRKHV